jgi:hypothetical protein
MVCQNKNFSSTAEQQIGPDQLLPETYWSWATAFYQLQHSLNYFSILTTYHFELLKNPVGIRISGFL